MLTNRISYHPSYNPSPRFVSSPAPTHLDIDISALNETALRRYSQAYEYDELGNILKVLRLGSCPHETKLRNKILIL
ncbi:MAG: hypothetical protein GY816_07865 [Cytophagales bacterium]|nr:hypothetical protein [Cytophagales bacterium]